MKIRKLLPRCPRSRCLQRLVKVSLVSLVVIFFMACLSGQCNFDPNVELNLGQTPRKLLSTPRNILRQNSIETKQETALTALLQNITRKDDPLFSNITRLGKTRSLLVLLPEENYLTHNQSVFKLNMSVSNTFDYELLISGSDICANDEKVYLFIIIPSVAGDFERRKAIRRTWLGVGARKLLPHVEPNVTVKHIFLLGLRPRAIWSRLQAESRRHRDIVLSAFLDTYRNLTTKVLVGFNWVVHHCPQAQIVLKVDQDTLINMPLMLRLLFNIQHKAVGVSNDFVLGLAHMRPVVRRAGKWGVSKSTYPLTKFPMYMYGHTYAVSSPGGTTRLLKAARHFPLLAPEDAFITGVLAKTTSLARLTSPAFTVCCRRLISRCEVVWNQRAAFTGLDTPALLDSLWMDIAHGHCNPKQHFKDLKPKNGSNLQTLKQKSQENVIIVPRDSAIKPGGKT